jgi:tRNA (adenine22-N1)-methyltransferase
MIKLSKRMKAVAAMVTSGGVLADVGTDHGYIPIALIQRQKIKSAIAMDINKGPLARAQDNIASARLGDYIQTRLSDGVAALGEGEADSILIAGMGGELVIHILSEGEKVCKAASELILQPQSDIRKVREYLRLHHYKIVDEDMICEDGKYYPMMRVINVELDNAWMKMDEQTRVACDIYGPLLLRNGNPVLRRFLVRQHRQLTQILQTLQAQTMSEKIETRIAEVLEELQYNESAYTILGAIKNAGI